MTSKPSNTELIKQIRKDLDARAGNDIARRRGIILNEMMHCICHSYKEDLKTLLSVYTMNRNMILEKKPNADVTGIDLMMNTVRSNARMVALFEQAKQSRNIDEVQRDFEEFLAILDADASEREEFMRTGKVKFTPTKDTQDIMTQLDAMTAYAEGKGRHH